MLINGPVIPLRPENRQQPYEIKAQENEGEIYLYDVIGDSWEGTTGKQFAEDLKRIGNVATLNIYINSPGGSVFDGTAIHNVLKRHNANKIVHVDGLAASIASVVAMAGDEIRIANNGMMMIHDPWAIAMGSAADFRKMADSLDKVRDSILATYVERSSTDEETLNRWMADETWFTAEEAVEAGLADVITEQVDIAALGKNDLSAFKHVPDALKEAAKAAQESEPESEAGKTGKPHSAIAQMQTRLMKRGIERRPKPA